MIRATHARVLSVDEVQRILSDLESDQIERTSSTNNTDKFAKAVCAFANDLPGHGQPGYLLVGVDDDGAPTGLTVTDEQALADNGSPECTFEFRSSYVLVTIGAHA